MLTKEERQKSIFTWNNYTYFITKNATCKCKKVGVLDKDASVISTNEYLEMLKEYNSVFNPAWVCAKDSLYK